MKTLTLHASYRPLGLIKALAALVTMRVNPSKPASATFSLDGWQLRLAKLRQRRQLTQLSAEQLKDMGISPEQAELESRKGFWES